MKTQYCDSPNNKHEWIHRTGAASGERGEEAAAAARGGLKVERDGKLQELKRWRSLPRLLILSALARGAEVGRACARPCGKTAQLTPSFPCFDDHVTCVGGAITRRVFPKSSRRVSRPVGTFGKISADN